jgi:hypothetical protein
MPLAAASFASGAAACRYGGGHCPCVNLSNESMTKPELLRRHVSKREFWM